MNPINCPLCKNQLGKVLINYSSPDSYEKAIGVLENNYSRQWIRCSECGLDYSRYSRDENLIDEIYKKKYRDLSSNWREEGSHDKFKRIINLPKNDSETKLRIEWIKNRLPSASLKKSKKLIDIGGGSGVFAYEFIDSSWEATLIDLDRTNVYLDRFHNVNVIRKDFLKENFKPYYDLATMVFVLEHVKDPLLLLQKAISSIKEDGHIYIEVPDSLSFKYKPKDDDVFNSCHLTLYSLKTIENLLYLSNLEIVDCDQYTTLRNYMSLRVLAKLKN